MLRKPLMIPGLLAVVFLAGCSSKPAAPAQPAAVSPISAEDADRQNPTAMSASSIQSGGDLYHGSDCALCHGKEGNGKGFDAGLAHMNVHDWRDASYNKSFTDGQLYSIIVKGKGLMPAYEKRNTPDQTWLMVDYIRSLSKN